jgi:hypothetical protein
MSKSRLACILCALLAASVPVHLASCGNVGGPNSGSGGDGDGGGGGGGGGDGGGGGGSGGGGDNVGSPLGMNLSEITYYSSDFPWVDGFRLSQPFLHQREGTWELPDPFDKRADGYPRSLRPGHWAGCLMFVGVEGRYPGGNYTCLYDGKGRIEFDWSAKVISAQPGRMTVQVTPSRDGIWMRLVETDPADPVRNIRFIMPGFESTYRDQPWQPDFTNRWKEFKVLRFMDWLRTNNSKVKEWADRTPQDYQTQGTDQGVSGEEIAALCNSLKADPWICIPHQASDDYVRKCAELFKARLDTTLTLYVEYSNEVWNGQFDQHWYCGEQGMRLGLDGDRWLAALRYYSQRSVEIFAIFESVFGGRTRLHRVIAAQAGNDWTGQTVLDWKDAYKKCDSIAIAPYFGGGLGDPATQGSVSQMTQPQLLAELDRRIANSMADLDKYVAVARDRGLAITGYEGGQHLAGHGGAENNQALTNLFTSANRNAGMEQLYDKYLAGWKARGAGMLCLFNSTMVYSKWGSWGALEYYDQDLTAPAAAKYRSMVKFIRANKQQ